MSQPLPLSVDVAVQDCCFAPAEMLSSPISESAWEEWFHCWLDRLQPNLADSNAYELGLRLTTDAEIQSFNAQYRQQDKPTDVLAFAALEVAYPTPAAFQDQPLYLGDIIISVETAQQQAIAAGHNLRQELAWLAAHALLHLLGWDHPDDESLARMLSMQAVLLEAAGLPRSSLDAVPLDSSTTKSGEKLFPGRLHSNS